MARGFQFRLQQLLELRRLHEQESARRVADARRDAEQARDAVDLLAQVRTASASALGQAHGASPSAGELQRMQLLLSRLDEHISGAGEALQSAEAAVETRIADYSDAARLRQVLDRLRERHHQVWQSALAHSEQKELDEIAVLRHRLRPDAQEA